MYRFDQLDLELIVSKDGWRGLQGVIQDLILSFDQTNKTSLNIDLLKGLGLGMLGGIDVSILSLLRYISDDSTFEQGVNQLRVRLLKKLKNQIEKRGPTFLFQLDEFEIDPELALFIPDILRLREEEMENVAVINNGTKVDLLPLWSTGHGFRILGAINVRRFTDVKGLVRIRESMAEAGYTLRIIQDNPRAQVVPKMSNGLKKYLIQRVEHPERFMTPKRVMTAEPEVTPSVLAGLPQILRDSLEESQSRQTSKKKSILISSNSLANKFILSRWGIRPSQRRRYRNLFTTVRRQCRVVFQHYLTRGRIEWESNNSQLVFGVYKFDEIRGNLILGFVCIPPESEWTLPIR